MIISSVGKDDIYRWFDNISTDLNVISNGNCELTLIIAASKLDWGVILGVCSTNGRFT